MDKVITRLDGSNEEADRDLKKLLGLNPDQSFDELPDEEIVQQIEKHKK